MVYKEIVLRLEQVEDEEEEGITTGWVAYGMTQAAGGMAVQHNSPVYIDPHDALTALLAHMASWHLLPLGSDDEEEEGEEELSDELEEEGLPPTPRVH